MGKHSAYRTAAKALGALLAERNIELIYGGTKVGLMGEVADAVLKRGGRAVGVIPGAIMPKEIAHQGLTKLHVVGSMHERKAMMSDLADAFIALPGGFGTFEEFCEVLTWAQLGLQQKPCGLLNVENYYDPLLALFDHAVDEQFLKPENRRLVLADSEPAQLLEKLASYEPQTVSKWIGRESR